MAICFLLGGNSFFFLFAWIARLTHLRIIDLCFSCPANGLALYTNRAFMNELCHPRVKFPRVKWNLIRMNNRAFVRATSRHSIQFHLGAGGGGGAWWVASHWMLIRLSFCIYANVFQSFSSLVKCTFSSCNDKRQSSQTWVIHCAENSVPTGRPEWNNRGQGFFLGFFSFLTNHSFFFLSSSKCDFVHQQHSKYFSCHSRMAPERWAA